MNKELKEISEYESWLYGGLESLLCTDPPPFNKVTGCESYYALYLDAVAISGSESDYQDSIKKTASNVAERIVDLLNNVKTYFLGDGEKNAENSIKKAQTALEGLSKLDPNIPIDEKSRLRNIDTYLVKFNESVLLEVIEQENTQVKEVIENLNKFTDDVKNADTGSKLYSVLNDLTKAVENGINVLSNALTNTINDSNQEVNKLKNPNLGNEEDSQEVKDGIKEENKKVIEEAKSHSEKVKILGDLYNSFIKIANNISSAVEKIVETPPKSKFKG